MASPITQTVPKPLRNRAKALEDSETSLEITYHALVLLQQGTLYLASLAFAEYRGLTETPDLKAELALASYVKNHPTFGVYRKLLQRCVKATGRQSKLHPLFDATFAAAHKLEVLREVADEHPHKVAPTYKKRMKNLDRQPPKFDEYLNILSKFRNQAFAHNDWHAFDEAEDLFEQAAPALRQVAREFFACREVRSAWAGLCPATVHEIEPTRGDSYIYTVITSDKSESVKAHVEGDIKTFAPSLRAGEGDEIMLVRNDGEEPLIVHSYVNLADGEKPDPEIESIIKEQFALDQPDEALAVLTRFAEAAEDNKTLLKKWLPTPLVDDVVISALQHFKLNGDTMDKAIPRNARFLLEHTDSGLPARIVYAADRFAEVAVRHPSESRRRCADKQLMTLASSSSHDDRWEAAVELGFKSDEISRQQLEDMAQRDVSRKVRKQALLSLGHGPGREAGPEVSALLKRFADMHRSDPEMACCALIGLGASNDGSCVDFIAEYVLGDAPHACTDAAAWALAELTPTCPDSVGEWTDELLRFATDVENDPYTRGTVLYCLSKLNDPDIAGVIATLVNESEDAFVVEDACAALAAIDDPCCVETLAAVLEASDGTLGDLCVKREVIRSLGVIGGKRAAAALEAYTPPDGYRFIERVHGDAIVKCQGDPDQPGERQPVGA